MTERRAVARIRPVTELVRVCGQDVERVRYRIIWIGPCRKLVASPLFRSRRHAEYMAVWCGAELVESETA